MSLGVVLLGTGNPLPDPQRAGPATLVEAGDRRLLFDAGRGVCMRLAGAGTLPGQLDAVLLTHLHSDHICDLGDLVTTQWITSFTPDPLRVFGPPGTAEVLDGVRRSLGPDVRYRLAHHRDLSWDPQVAVTEVTPGPVYEDGGFWITAAASDHRPVEPTLAYRVEDGDHAVVIAGDTLPCSGLDELCRRADIYVQTVLRDDLVRQVPLERFRETIDYHSTVEQAARTAERAGVRTLVLTHQVPAPAPGTDEEWTEVARRHFGGEVVFGEDLRRVVIP